MPYLVDFVRESLLRSGIFKEKASSMIEDLNVDIFVIGRSFCNSVP